MSIIYAEGMCVSIWVYTVFTEVGYATFEENQGKHRMIEQADGISRLPALRAEHLSRWLGHDVLAFAKCYHMNVFQMLIILYSLDSSVTYKESTTQISLTVLLLYLNVFKLTPKTFYTSCGRW